MSKTTKIADEVKVYRLVPLALAIAYIWSISTIMMGETPSGGLAEFIGYYIGTGLPRFAVYLFCLGFILYNYNKISLDHDHVVVGAVISFIGGSLLVADGLLYRRDIHVWHYSGLFLTEHIFYRGFLTQKPDTTPSEE